MPIIAQPTYIERAAFPCQTQYPVRLSGAQVATETRPTLAELAIELFLLTMSAAPVFDGDFVDRLREGDEAAFSSLLDTYHGALFRLARSMGASNALAEEIVQETWVAVIAGISNFEGRSTLKTWIFAILTNQARRHTAREARMPPLSALFSDEAVHSILENQEQPSNGASSRTFSWSINPEDRMGQQALMEVIQQAVDELPANQRTVLILRDFEGVSPDDCCEILEISDGNHRVLLHRARHALRLAVTAYYERVDAEVAQ